MKKLPILDTNIIIRFLANDTPEQADKIDRMLNAFPKKSLFIPDVVVAEIVYVLLSFYKMAKHDVVEKIELVIELQAIKCNATIIKKAIDIYKRFNISYVDAYLCALVKSKKHSILYSFDRKLKKVLVSELAEPK